MKVEAVPTLTAATLDGLFYPKSIAFLGTERSVISEQALRSLQSGDFRAPLSICGTDGATHASLRDVPGKLDLVVAATAPQRAPEVVADCVARDVKGVVLLSSGFGSGNEYAKSANQMRELLRDSRTRVLGPNSLGVLNPNLGLNATPGLPMPLGGTVAYLGQSPMLSRYVLDWSLKHIVGFSCFAALGSMLDVDWANLIDYFGQDPHTRTIVLEIHTLGDARSLISAAREVSLAKPIIVIKTGRHPLSLRALAVNPQRELIDDEVLAAAFHRVGVLQVEGLEDLFYAADALSKQPRPRGPRLMLIGNAVGPAILAADSVLEAGVELCEPTPEIRAHLEQLLSPQDSIDDVVGDRSPENFFRAVEIVSRDANCDGVLALVVPSALSDPQRTAELLVSLKTNEKPVLLSYTGSGDVSDAQENLSRACLPTFPSPATAARVFRYMWRYSYDLQALYEIPARHVEVEDLARRTLVRDFLFGDVQHGRSRLSLEEAAVIFGAYGISIDPSAADLSAYRAKLAARYDPQFGPVLLFGAADRGEDVYGDRVVGLPPLNATLARRMLERSAFYVMLRRECSSASVLALEALLVQLSQIITEQPRIRSLELGPILLLNDDCRIQSCRCELHPAELPDESIQRPAIRPYPAQYVAPWTMKNGEAVTIRPICAEDEPLMVAFHQELSDQSVYLRFFQRIKLSTRTAHDRLVRVCFLDYDREFALLAEHTDPQTGARSIIAIGSFQKIPWKKDAEIAVLISDRYHGQGLGRELIARLVGVARDEGIRRLTAVTMMENRGMRAIFEKLGFRVDYDEDEQVVTAELTL